MRWVGESVFILGLRLGAALASLTDKTPLPPLGGFLSVTVRQVSEVILSICQFSSFVLRNQVFEASVNRPGRHPHQAGGQVRQLVLGLPLQAGQFHEGPELVEGD